RGYPAETFLLHRAEKIAWIPASMRPRLGHQSRIKTPLERKTGFHWGIIKSTDYEIFAVMTLRTAGEFLIFIRQPLHNFRPRNVRTSSRWTRQETCGHKERNCGKTEKPDHPGASLHFLERREYRVARRLLISIREA